MRCGKHDALSCEKIDVRVVLIRANIPSKLYPYNYLKKKGEKERKKETESLAIYRQRRDYVSWNANIHKSDEFARLSH